MSQFPKYFKEMLEEKPIEACSLKLYPIRMKSYREWMLCKPVLLLRLGTLPADYAQLPYISALYAMDYDAAVLGKPAGYMAQWLILLCLALNISVEETLRTARLEHFPDNPRKFSKIILRQGGTLVQLQAKQCAQLRKILALQNGESLPDEAENPELLQAREVLASTGAPSLEYNLFALMDSVAYQSGIRMRQLLDWTVWEFETRAKSIQRSKQFTVNGICEGYGAKWKNGNPYPSWCYDRERGKADGFLPETAILNKLGQVGHIQEQKGRSI